MPSNKHLPQLRDALADLYPRDADVRRVTRDAGLNEARITFDPKAVNSWDAILLEAQQQGLLEKVIVTALKEYPGSAGLRDAAKAYRESILAPTGMPPAKSSASRRHLETQLSELQERYDTLTKRIEALNKDIGRAIDAVNKQVLEERRADLMRERDEVAATTEGMEQQLAGRDTPLA